MTSGYIGVPVEIPGGKKLATTELTVGANDVHREQVHLSGSAAAAIIEPTNTDPATTDYRLPVQPAGALPEVTSSGTLNAQNSTVSLSLQGRKYCAVDFDAQDSFNGDPAIRVKNSLGIWDNRFFWDGNRNSRGSYTTFPNGTVSEPGVTFSVPLEPGDTDVEVYVYTATYSSGSTGCKIVASDRPNAVWGAGAGAAMGIDGGNPAETTSESPLSMSIGGKDSTNPLIHRTMSVDKGGRVLTRPWGPGGWAQGAAPGANTLATTTKAAGAAGVKHVCTGLQATLVADATAPAAIQLLVLLRDGASGAGTVLAAYYMSLPATAGAACPPIVLSDLNIRGSAATAMTLEFNSAGGGHTYEGLSLQGISVTE